MADEKIIRNDRDAAVDEIERLQDAIRQHRDERGDDRCWADDERLYAVLPEGYTPPVREVAVELENCKRFLECRRNPKTEYVSSQVEIDRLKALLVAKNSALEVFASKSMWCRDAWRGEDARWVWNGD